MKRRIPARNRPGVGKVLDHLPREDDVERPVHLHRFEVLEVRPIQVRHTPLPKDLDAGLVEIEPPQLGCDPGQLEVKEALHLQPLVRVGPVGAPEVEDRLPPADVS